MRPKLLISFSGGVFYRGHRTAKDIVELSKILVLPPLPDEEEDTGCSESCEAFV